MITPVGRFAAQAASYVCSNTDLPVSRSSIFRGKRVDAEGMQQFIDSLALPEAEKVRLKAMTPANYIGRAVTLVDELK